MSLNEKYIINGSTLSGIGDALRTKGIISPTKEVSFTRWYRIDSGSAQSSYSSTTTHTAESDFYQGTYFEYNDIITKAKVIFTSIDSTVYLNGSGKNYNDSVGKEFIVSYPFTIRIDGSIASPSMRYSYECKIIPLNDNEEQLQLTEILTDRQPSSYLHAEEATRKVPNTIAVGDLAASILQHSYDKIQFLAPFRMGGYSNYSSNSTVLPEDIHTITDIKKLYVIVKSGSSSYIRVAKLEPAIATKTTHQSLGGDLGAGITYRMKYYDFSRTAAATANWDTSLNESTVGYYDIFYKESTRQLIQVTGGSSTIVNAIGVAALLIY